MRVRAAVASLLELAQGLFHGAAQPFLGIGPVAAKPLAETVAKLIWSRIGFVPIATSCAVAVVKSARANASSSASRSVTIAPRRRATLVRETSRTSLPQDASSFPKSSRHCRKLAFAWASNRPAHNNLLRKSRSIVSPLARHSIARSARARRLEMTTSLPSEALSSKRPNSVARTRSCACLGAIH